MRNRILTLCLLTSLIAAPTVMAQRADEPIEPKRLPHNDATILGKLKDLRESGRLLSTEQIGEALVKPAPEALTLPPASSETRRPTEIAAHARKAFLRVGWCYLCNKCSNWHLNTANAYALTKDGVIASCYHVFEADLSTMREGYAFAMNADGDVFPITAILAADKTMDAAVFRVEGSGFTPLALNDQISRGDAVYLLSDPKEYAGYFSAGIVNRFYWDVTRQRNNLDTVAGIVQLRMDVSTDWAPGSSGAAILDGCGNVVGHVSTIQTEMAVPNGSPIRSPSASPPASSQPSTRPVSEGPPRATQIVFHQGIPARSVRLLIEAMDKASKQSAGR